MTASQTSAANTAGTAEFQTLSDLLRRHAQTQPQAPALSDNAQSLNWAQLDAQVDQIAASLQRDGCRPGEVIAICAAASVRYALVFLGALRAGVVVAPLAPSVTAASMASMLQDAQPQYLFVDSMADGLLPPAALQRSIWIGDIQPAQTLEQVVASPHRSWSDWLLPEGSAPFGVKVGPADAFNIIYSSGTTGTPKGIVQPHGMRWVHIERGPSFGYSEKSVTLLATPLYSNTTLVSFFPTLGWGGHVRLMPKFNALEYLKIAQSLRVTHTMLVPVQYQRIMALEEFDRFDLSSYQMKFCTSAPFKSALKSDILKRWPGGLIELYGMTEGGGTCSLIAHLHPNKLHTVGQPSIGSDIRLIDENEQELPADQLDADGLGPLGEIVGHSGSMMTGYHQQPEKTREAEWFDAQGKRFIRTGDVGRFDADGFLTLFDRRKDMIISGGFNVYPSDLENDLSQHPAVHESAVVGVPSEAWGETPVAFICLKQSQGEAKDQQSGEQILQWFNARAGKTQRLASVHIVAELPRSAIGKVLKRELRDWHQAQAKAVA